MHIDRGGQSWPPGGEDQLIDRLADDYITNDNLDLGSLLADNQVGRVALVSSFGADSIVLLHKVLQLSPNIDVLFLDTGKHFPETLRYVDQVCEFLDIRNFRAIQPDAAMVLAEDPKGNLWSRDPNMCCTIRKTFALQDALVEFDGWLTGRKRYQGGIRAGIPYLERDGKHLKINPLIRETPESLRNYISTNGLPQHPLVARGYRSIGCGPCTKPVKPGEDERSGRWQGVDKVECGIHLGPSGHFVRG